MFIMYIAVDSFKCKYNYRIIELVTYKIMIIGTFTYVNTTRDKCGNINKNTLHFHCIYMHVCVCVCIYKYIHI